MTEPGYTFLSYYRTGIAAGLRSPFDVRLKPRATAHVVVPVRAQAKLNAGFTGGPDDVARVAVTVRGPADVASIDVRQVIRRHPMPGTSNAEPGDLAHIEFDRPYLPWQFTPAAPTIDGQLPPWLRLVVVDAGRSILTPATPDRLAVLTTPEDELPPVAEAWAWAHAQIMGSDTDAALAAEAPALNLSRLLCPRRLTEDRDWIACVVPVFAAGVETGLGGDPSVKDLRFATAQNGSFTLPVYDSWAFRTGRDGDFATLAGRLRPPPPDLTGDVGFRRVDTAHPGNGIDDLADGQDGRSRAVYGALTAVDAHGSDGHSWPAAQTEQLRAQLETSTTADGAPIVGPPLYAGAHKAFSGVSDSAPQWFGSVNLDPADRIAAGLGTRVVQMDQEALMAAAWTQAAGVAEANDALRAAQFARYLSESLHRRLVKMQPADQLVITNPLAGRLLTTSGRTVLARINASGLPSPAVRQLRRFVAPRKPVMRFTKSPTAGVSDAAARTNTVRRLFVNEAGEVREWVLQYRSPDGVSSVDTGIQVEGLDGGVGVTGGTVGLGPGLPEEFLQNFWPPQGSDPGPDPLVDASGLMRNILNTVLGETLTTLPTGDEIRTHPELATAAADVKAQLGAIVAAGHDVGLTDWRVDAEVADLAGLAVTVTPGGVSTISTAQITSLAADLGALAALPAEQEVTVDAATAAAKAAELKTAHDAEVAKAAELQRAMTEVGRQQDGDIAKQAELERQHALHVNKAAELQRELEIHRQLDLRRQLHDQLHLGQDLDVHPLDLPGLDPPVPEVPGAAPGPGSFAVPAVPPLRGLGAPSATDFDSALYDRLKRAIPADYSNDRLRADLKDLLQPWTLPGVAEPARPALLVTDLQMAESLAPAVTMHNRVLARLTAHGALPDWLAARNWFADNVIEPVLAGPVFPHAMYEALHRYDPEWLMPGVAELQPANLVTVLQSNKRFVEAFLIGCNTEFGRELIWRGYPTDGRATSFASFWTDEPEMPALNEFADAPLGDHLTPSIAEAIVVVVRGDVVRQYPNALVELITQDGDRDPPRVFAATGGATAVFRLHLEPDILLLGFALPSSSPGLQTPTRGRDGAWWFTLSEHVGEPRFGLLEPTVTPAPAPAGTSATPERDQLTWSDVQLDSGGHILAAKPKVAASADEFILDAAHFGWLLFRHPERAAFAATTTLIPAEGNP